jgi:hypothetical protein
MSKMVAMRNSPFRATLPRPVVARGRGTDSRHPAPSPPRSLAKPPCSAMRFTGAPLVHDLLDLFMTSSTALSVGL